MGRIGPPQQRFEVLPVPSWDLDDLLATWRTHECAEVSGRPPAGPRSDERAAGSDGH